jgi:predicted dithiol-disulfide oxidoreductase (DUF899 family)
MNYSDGTRRLSALRKQIATVRDEMRKLQAAIEPEAVRDYPFATIRGETRLSQLFGSKQDLFVIHNMGSACPYCTLWADGYNGIYDHLASRAAFVVSSPDAPEVQREFAAGRGWRFPMISHRGTSFAEDMGYRSPAGGWLPGVSVFQLNGGSVYRVCDTGFSPGDDFCALWHFLDLLPEGAGEWQPRFSYPRSAVESPTRALPQS